MTSAQVQARASNSKRFKIILPNWKWKGTPEDQERLRKLEDEYCERGLCTREELDNWKLLSLQMVPGFIKNIIVPALVQEYLKEMELKKAKAQVQEHEEQRAKRRGPKGRKSKPTKSGEERAKQKKISS